MTPKYELRLKGWPQEDSSSETPKCITTTSCSRSFSSSCSSSATAPGSTATTLSSNTSIFQRSTPLSTSSTTLGRHLSLAYDRISAKRIKDKKDEIQMAVKYCRENDFKGYKAMKELDLKYVKDAHIINQHLSGKVANRN